MHEININLCADLKTCCPIECGFKNNIYFAINGVDVIEMGSDDIWSSAPEAIFKLKINISMNFLKLNIAISFCCCNLSQNKFIKSIIIWNNDYIYYKKACRLRWITGKFILLNVNLQHWAHLLPSSAPSSVSASAPTSTLFGSCAKIVTTKVQQHFTQKLQT